VVLMSLILATWEVEFGRILILGQPRQKVSRCSPAIPAVQEAEMGGSLSRPAQHNKNKTQSAGGMVQVVDPQPSKHSRP
jgi:hypothetical protein